MTVDRLETSQPLRGARWFVLSRTVTVNPGQTVDALAYQFPDVREGVLRGYGITILSGTGPANVQIKLGGRIVPSSANTDYSLVSVPSAEFIELMEQFRSRDRLNVTVKNSGITVITVNVRFKGWWYE